MAGFEDVGAALASLRKRAGISQEDLAVKLQMKGGTSVSAIETGNPRAASIHRYLVALGRTPRDLAEALEQMTYSEDVELGQPEVREPEAEDPIDLHITAITSELRALGEEVKRRSPKG